MGCGTVKGGECGAATKKLELEVRWDITSLWPSVRNRSKTGDRSELRSSRLMRIFLLYCSSGQPPPHDIIEGIPPGASGRLLTVPKHDSQSIDILPFPQSSSSWVKCPMSPSRRTLWIPYERWPLILVTSLFQLSQSVKCSQEGR